MSDNSAGSYRVVERRVNPVGVIGWVSYEIQFQDNRGNFSLKDISGGELPKAIAAAESQGYERI